MSFKGRLFKAKLELIQHIQLRIDNKASSSSADGDVERLRDYRKGAAEKSCALE